LVGLTAGALATGAVMASRRLPNETPETHQPDSKTPSGD
jgi:hypothetical protein